MGKLSFRSRISTTHYGRCLGKLGNTVQCPCSRRNDPAESTWSALGREMISKTRKVDMSLSKKVCRHLRQSLLGGFAAHSNVQERKY